MTLPLLRLDNVDVALDGKTILRGISWRLLPGEHWAILGGNGSGKSTLLRLIRGDLAPKPGRGRRVYALEGSGQTSAVGVKEAMACVSPELQQRYLRQDWQLTARQVIQSGVHGGDYAYERLTAPEVKRCGTLARRMGVAHLLGRSAQELSTGELRRVLIARSLAGVPRVLVCDEICDGLDAASRAGLLKTLDRVARTGTQLLLTTHRAGELVPSITHRLVLEHGRIVECGGIEPKRRRTGILPVPPGILPADETGAGSPGDRQDACPTTERPVEGRAFTVAATGFLIRIQNASVFLGRRRVLRDVNWAMRAGEHWAILGPNGAGKSTFLKLVLGDLHPAWGGRVTRFDFTARNTIWEVKRRLGYVSPDFQAGYHEEITGADVVGSGFFSGVGRTQTLSARQRRRVIGILEQLGLESFATREAQRLSYGEFRKLLLARALVHEPELLIFDEPFDGLDATSREAMAQTLGRVAAGGTSLLIVTHHAGDLPACTTHVARLAAGRLEFQGPVGEFR